MRLERIIAILRINFAKSVLINFLHFGFQGLIKFPIILQYGSSIRGSKNSIIFSKPLQFNMLSLKYKNTILIQKGGKVVFHGRKACFNHMNSVNVGPAGVFEVGDSFRANGLAEFNCRKRIVFGDGCLISVHTIFLDTDFHNILRDGNVINPDAEIIIGNRVWIGCNVTVMKGVVIGNDIVIGAGSLLSGKYREDNSIYAGQNPSEPLKTGIVWSQ